MRIALNLAAVRGAGSAQVGRNILERFLRTTGLECRAWIPEAWDRAIDRALGSNAVRVPAGGVSKLFTENVSMRTALRSWRADRLFSLGDTSLPRSRAPHLLFVQQAYLAYERADWGFVPHLRFSAKMRAIEAYFALGVRSVDRITVQNAPMKRRLCARWNVDPNRVAIIPTGIVVLPSDAPRSRHDGPPFVICVANPSPHKNHVVLPELMAEVRRSHPELRCKLTLARDSIPGLVARAERLGVLDRFDFIGLQSHDTITRLLHSAVATVIPSLLESWGMTYFEAMAAGCPIVAADRDFARDACGDAALYAEPHSGADMARRLETLLDSPSSRDALAERGRARFDAMQKELDWDRIVPRYVALLEDM